MPSPPPRDICRDIFCLSRVRCRNIDRARHGARPSQPPAEALDGGGSEAAPSSSSSGGEGSLGSTQQPSASAQSGDSEGHGEQRKPKAGTDKGGAGSFKRKVKPGEIVAT